MENWEKAKRIFGDAVKLAPNERVRFLDDGLGEREEVLYQLEKAFRERDARMMLLKIEPKWNNLRREPRFIALLRRMNLQ